MRVSCGVTGVVSAGFGLHLAERVPWQTSSAAVGGGLFLTGVSMLLPSIKRLNMLGNELETWETDPDQDGSRLADELEALRARKLESADEVDPASVDLPGDDLVVGARYKLAERSIELLLTHLEGPLAGCEARLFVFDSSLRKLTPMFRPERPERPINWAPGQGVVGVAFDVEDYELAQGAATHDDTYGLTPEMQLRFTGLTAVAASPIHVAGRVVGVLALSTADEGPALATEEGYWAHQLLAELVSVALGDLWNPGLLTYSLDW